MDRGIKETDTEVKTFSKYQRKMDKIKQELSDSNTGWDFRQVMDLIQKRTGVRYTDKPKF